MKEYNEQCPCCNWKFYVATELQDGYGTKVNCVKCGSVWYSKKQ